MDWQPRSEFHFDQPQTDLWLGNVHYVVEDQELFGVCSKYGTCTRLRIIRDRPSGRSIGSAFARFATAEEAQRALKALDGLALRGRKIKVRPLQPPRETQEEQ